MDRNDERLVWKYMDGLADVTEVEFLLTKAKQDIELRTTLEMARQMDSGLRQMKTYALPDALKSEIFRNLSSKMIVHNSTTGEFGKGLKSFAMMNTALLLLGIGLGSYYANIVSDDKYLGQWQSISEMLDKPMVHTFFYFCMAFVLLLIIDEFLINRNYSKLTNPV